MSVDSGCFTDILGDYFGALGCFPLRIGRRLLSPPGDSRILRVSALKLTSFLTFHFYPRLQLLGPLSAHKRCQVKLGKSRGEESPGMFWGAFFPQETILAASVLVLCCVPFRGPRKGANPLTAEVKCKN